MREFFRAEWRAMGAAILGFTCLLMIGWVRSWSCTDTIIIRTTVTSIHELSSVDSSIAWARIQDMDGIYSGITSGLDSGDVVVRLDEIEATRRFNWNGFRVIEQEDRRMSGAAAITTAWAAPYWTVIMPLTILTSASRPKRSGA